MGLGKSKRSKQTLPKVIGEEEYIKDTESKKSTAWKQGICVEILGMTPDGKAHEVSWTCIRCHHRGELVNTYDGISWTKVCQQCFTINTFNI